MRIRSSMKGVSFPSIVSGPAAMLLSLMHQYEKSEWWTPDQLLEAQYGQLSLLADHALRTVPFHAERLLRAGFRSGEAMTPEIWKHLPVLTREEVRDHEGALKSSSCPSSFGAVSEVTSGGSTGVPVRVLKTALDALLWQAAHLREFLWHGIDFGREIANLRGMGGAGGISDAAQAFLPDHEAVRSQAIVVSFP